MSVSKLVVSEPEEAVSLEGSVLVGEAVSSGVALFDVVVAAAYTVDKFGTNADSVIRQTVNNNSSKFLILAL